VSFTQRLILFYLIFSGAFSRSHYSLFLVSGGGKAAAGNKKRAQTCRLIGARVAVFFRMKSVK